MIEQYGLKNIEWEAWVPYQALIDRISEADVCLGIFGSSGKAARVIPITNGRGLKPPPAAIATTMPATRVSAALRVKAYNHLLGECGVSFFAAPRLLRRKTRPAAARS